MLKCHPSVYPLAPQISTLTTREQVSDECMKDFDDAFTSSEITANEYVRTELPSPTTTVGGHRWVAEIELAAPTGLPALPARLLAQYHGAL